MKKSFYGIINNMFVKNKNTDLIHIIQCFADTNYYNNCFNAKQFQKTVVGIIALKNK
jgi:hypothetical protein